MSEPSTPTSSSTLRQRRPTTIEKAKARDSALVEAAAAADAPQLALLVQQHALPALRLVGQAVNVVGPLYLKAFALAHSAYKTAPLDLLEAAVGLGLCFFGGAYCASIAAAEAFHLATWSTTRAALEDIWEEALLIRDASAADDEKHGHVTSRADATPAELAQHKLRVALLAVRDPQKLSIAVGGLYAGWLAVIGTLRLNVAKTVTLGVSSARAAASRAAHPTLTSFARG